MHVTNSVASIIAFCHIKLCSKCSNQISPSVSNGLNMHVRVSVHTPVLVAIRKVYYDN